MGRSIVRAAKEIPCQTSYLVGNVSWICLEKEEGKNKTQTWAGEGIWHVPSTDTAFFWSVLSPLLVLCQTWFISRPLFLLSDKFYAFLQNLHFLSFPMSFSVMITFDGYHSHAFFVKENSCWVDWNSLVIIQVFIKLSLSFLQIMTLKKCGVWLQLWRCESSCITLCKTLSYH